MRVAAKFKAAISQSMRVVVTGAFPSWTLKNLRFFGILSLAVVSALGGALETKAFEGKYRPFGEQGFGWDCRTVGQQNGAFEISKNKLVGLEYGCELSDAISIPNSQVKQFNAKCFVEGSEYSSRITLMPWGSEDLRGVYVSEDGAIQQWQLCDDPPEKAKASSASKEHHATENYLGEVFASCSTNKLFLDLIVPIEAFLTSENGVTMHFAEGQNFTFEKSQLNYETVSESIRLRKVFSSNDLESKEFIEILLALASERSAIIMTGKSKVDVKLLGSSQALNSCADRLASRTLPELKPSQTQILSDRLNSESEKRLQELREQLGFPKQIPAAEQQINHGQVNKIAGLIKQWQQANGLCRGGAGASSTTALWCSQRNKIGKTLEDQGQCFGENQETMSEKEWATCDTDFSSKKQSEQGLEQRDANSELAISYYEKFLMFNERSSEVADPELAFQWLVKSAEAGYAKAQYQLGYAYEMGQGGLEPSKHEAKNWYAKSARQGFAKAVERLELVYINGPAFRPKENTRYAALLTCEEGKTVTNIHLCLENSNLTVVDKGKHSSYEAFRLQEAGSLLNNGALLLQLSDKFSLFARNSDATGFSLIITVREVSQGQHWRSIFDGNIVCREKAEQFGASAYCEYPNHQFSSSTVSNEIVWENVSVSKSQLERILRHSADCSSTAVLTLFAGDASMKKLRQKHGDETLKGFLQHMLRDVPEIQFPEAFNEFKSTMKVMEELQLQNDEQRASFTAILTYVCGHGFEAAKTELEGRN